MIEITQKMLLELTVLLLFVLAAASYAAYRFGSSIAHTLEKEASLKKQTAYELEMDELIKLNVDVLADEHQLKVHALEQSLLSVKMDAKYMAMDWVDSLPNEPLPHWNLAKAYDQLGEYSRAKKTLIHLQKKHPGWNIHIDDWLTDINARLTSKEVTPHSAPSCKQGS